MAGEPMRLPMRLIVDERLPDNILVISNDLTPIVIATEWLAAGLGMPHPMTVDPEEYRHTALIRFPAEGSARDGG